jgi:hypothetical protein
MLMRVLLSNFAMPSLALQAQKQADAIDILKDQGVRVRSTQPMWTWSDGPVNCESACTAVCPSATCNPELPCSIESVPNFQGLGSTVDLSGCESYDASGNANGPYLRDNGVCYFSSECNYDGCTKTLDPGSKILCACEVDMSVCTIAEDPHVNVFDNAQVSLLAETPGGGDKWLVSSERLKIQARFMKKKDSPSPDSQLFTRAVALGGDILNGNVMVVGSLEDDITWNGKPVLQDQESKFYVQDGGEAGPFFVDATRGSSSLVQDLSQENPGVNIRLQSGVSLIVNRLHGYVNIAIKMPQQAKGQDGLCGNFNGVGADDPPEMVAERFDVNVAPEESLFAGLSFE